jgi:glycosyltransferase involved in cell wall biosynthesis
MRILMAHNYYQQAGGEDIVFNAEKNLLLARGHEVLEYTESNDLIAMKGWLSAAQRTIWSKASYRAIKEVILSKKPDIAHFHNTFLMLSPSVYYACYEMGIPVVQSLHNYRLTCPSAILFRKGNICENCMGKSFPWPGFVHACYRNSFGQSLVVASMLAYHNLHKTWSEKVNAYITATKFSRDKMVQAGLAESKIFIKPNFIEYLEGHPSGTRDYALLSSRLTVDKGVVLVIKAWEQGSHIPFKITGDGPLRSLVIQLTESNPAVDYLGYLERNRLLQQMQNARFLIFPSQMYEVFPMAIVEAFACGIPVVASRIGVMAEIIRDMETGMLFKPGDVTDFLNKTEWLWNHPEEADRMGRQARLEFEKDFTPERNYELLMDIYRKVKPGSLL